MVEAILRTLRDTWSGYLDALLVVLPRLLSTLSVVLVGWLIAAVARAVAARLLGWLRLPRLAERTGAAEFLRKAELPGRTAWPPRSCSGCCSAGSCSPASMRSASGRSTCCGRRSRRSSRG